MPKCLECGITFQDSGRASGRRGRFCSVQHKAVFHNRRASRGVLLYDALVLHNQAPEKYKDFPARIELMLTQWAEEDKKAGHAVTTQNSYDVGYKLPRIDMIKSYV